MRKGKDPDPNPDLWLMDPDPGDPKTCGSGSPTLQWRYLDEELPTPGDALLAHQGVDGLLLLLGLLDLNEPGDGVDGLGHALRHFFRLHLGWKSQRIKIRRLGLRFLNLYPRVWVSCWKSQTFGKSLRNLGSWIFFLEIFKIHRLVWIFL